MQLRIGRGWLLAAIGTLLLGFAFEGLTAPVVVTATRTQTSTADTLASVSVITREDIERLQPTSTEELLRALPGVDVAQNGPFGKATSVFIRGTNSDHVVVLVDGIRVGEASSGSANLQYLPPEHIQRIEVVRGPRASLYGPDAVGGVIQIFTRESASAEAGYSARADVGSFGSERLGAGYTGGYGNTRWDVYGSGFSTDGIDVLGDGDADGYRYGAASAGLSHRFANGIRVAANAFRTEGNTEFDGFMRETDFVKQFASTDISAPVTRAWFTRLTIGRSWDDSENFGGGGVTEFNNRRWSVRWQNDYAVSADHLLSAGVDYLSDELADDSDFGGQNRYNIGVFLQDQLRFGRNDLAASLRYDNFSEIFDDQVTGSLAVSRELEPGLRGIFSFGTAYRVPTLNELYFPGFGNTQLEPEESRSFELALDHRSSEIGWRVTLFHNEIDNLIAAVERPPGSFIFVAENVNEARISGMEVSTDFHWMSWFWRVSGTLQDHEDENTGNFLPRRARQSLRVEADRSLGLADVGWTVLAAGERFSDSGNTRRMAGYTLVDLRASYPLAPGWRLKGTINNVLERDYELVKGFNQPERTFFVSLQYETP